MVIHIITGTIEKWAQSRNKRMQHLRSILTIQGSSKRSQEDENQQIKFFLFDTNIVEDNGNDPIAISDVISIFLVERILVDDGSVVKILMWKAFEEMNLYKSLFRPIGLIYGFANQNERYTNAPGYTRTWGAYYDSHD